MTRLALLFLLGFCLAWALMPSPTPTWLIWVAIGLAGTGWLVRRWTRFWTAIAVATLGAAIAPSAASTVDFDAGAYAITATVVQARPHDPHGPSCDVELAHARPVTPTLRGPPKGTRLRLRPCTVTRGDTLSAFAEVRPRAEFRNGLPSWHAAAVPRVTASLITPARIVRTNAMQHGTQRLLERLRDRTRSALTRTLPEPARGLAIALVLGDEYAVNEDVSDDVRKLGLTHVLAVSGLHIVIVVGALRALLALALRRCAAIAARWPAEAVASFAAVPIVFVYAAFAGGAPSAWRAAWMSAVAWGLRASHRNASVPSALGASAIAFTVIDPEGATSLGFWLSTLATASLVSGTSTTHASKIRRVLHETWSSTWRCTLGTLPLLIATIGVPSPFSLVWSLVFVPFGNVCLLPVVTLHALVATCSPRLGNATAPFAQMCLALFASGARIASELTPSWHAPTPTTLQMIAWVVAVLALLSRLRARTRIGIVCVAALAIVGSEWRLHQHTRGDLRITFLDVGQGDGALIRMPDGTLWMIDVGGQIAHAPDAGLRAVLPVLRAERRTRIDVLVLSHPHPDHVGGLGALMNEVDIGEVWSTYSSDDVPDETLRAQLHVLASRGTRIVTPNALCNGQQRHGDATLHVLAPCPGPDALEDENDNSFVIRLKYGANSVLFAGDIERRAEASLVRTHRNEIASDILKVPHHGSRTSSTSKLLRAVSPRLAIISAGRPSPFGHPHRDVIARFARERIHWLSTPLCGAISLTSDGVHWKTETVMRCDQSSTVVQPASSMVPAS